MADELQVFPIVGPDGVPTTVLLPKDNESKPPRWVVVFGLVVNLIVLATIVAVLWKG
jgi:hypothetical protein